MDRQKVLEVIGVYRKYFEEMDIPQINFPHGQALNIFDDVDGLGNMLAHCHGMLDEMEKFVAKGSMDKVFRWLGFVQGCLWSNGLYTLDELKNHNRPDSAELFKKDRE